MAMRKETPSAHQLHLAALKGDFPTLKKILESGKVYVDCVDEEGTTALILACANHHYECAKELLEQGANPAAAREDGGTPLLVACQCNQLEVVQELYSRGASIHTQMTDKATALFVAAQNGHLKLVQYLLSLQADVNAKRTDGATPLWIACQMGHTSVVKELLEHNAEVDAVRADGATPLFKAAHKGYADIVELLVQKGASLGLLKNGETALHAAALFDHLPVVKILVAAGCDPEFKNQDGSTPWELAHEAGNVIVADFLQKIMSSRKTPDHARAS